MKTFYPLAIIIVVSFFALSFNKLDKNGLTTRTLSSYSTSNDNDVVDTEVLNDFFKRYSDLKKYQNEVTSLYKNRSYETIWYSDNKITEFGKVLHQKMKDADDQGLEVNIPYREEIEQIFDKKSKEISKSDADMLLSAAYVIYMRNVYEGLDAETVKKTGWLLPKKKLSYDTLLDSLMTNPTLLEKNNVLLFDQYYKLEGALKKYKQIEADNNWKPMTVATPYKDIRPDEKSITVAQIRNRLFIMGDLKTDSKSDFYDRELMDGVMHYKVRNGLKPNYIIGEDHIKDLNEPIGDKIKKIMINMERCRWISPKLVTDNEYVMVNIPSFELVYVKNGQVELVSNVFVGSQLTKTSIFNGNIDKIVFSPYWTVPQSIVDNELKLKMAADKNYLADNNMEMVNGQVRQKPGAKNSLGLVKFIFPNPEDIYMHDTPSKTLFDFEKRTFSHGCINVQKAKELAVAMLKDYPEWTQSRIDDAMAGKEESTFKLPNKIPIYITYFTTWVNDAGEISFYQDVYNRDSELNGLLFPTAEMAAN
ncbi:L,D-transpeptidase family protein [Flavobacterium sp. N1736]|uniref:L,D-transpeptidase family protein n=1 Tax=Flavobacterium sp. N1736 TaxID=2986823 RepID=UPI002223F5B3|nr:L,D-transpeptidase family protein [Flavobacterium sp. N1736]